MAAETVETYNKLKNIKPIIAIPRKLSRRRLEAFWKMTLDELRNRGAQEWDIRRPSKRNYLQRTAEVSNCKYRLHIVNEVATVDLYLERSKVENKWIFDQLNEKKREIEDRFGAELTWQREDHCKHSKIRYLQSLDVYDEDNWQEVVEWLCEHIVKLERAFEEPLGLLGQELESRGAVSLKNS